MKLSVLDLIPVSQGQTSQDAVAATLALVEQADRLGLERYWFAEHHNMPSVASTAPAVTAAAAAARTSRIRVGSGGVMLPNHSPFVVAEQFAMLNAIAPDRIDLGIGRAPGSDPVVTALLRASGPTSDVDQFAHNIDSVLALLERDGAQLSLTDGKRYSVRATPVAESSCPVWLLGSSDFSAKLAAEHGLAYVFAHHFSGEGTERALELYRNNFRPSVYAQTPTTLMTVNVSTADTAQEALARAMPQLVLMSKLQTGRPLTVLDYVEDAPNEPLDAMQRQLIDQMLQRWVVADADEAAKQIKELANRFEADEVMVQFASGVRRDEPVDRSVGREAGLELLAARMLDTAVAGAR